MDVGNSIYGLVGPSMKLRHPISLKSQIVYIQGRKPKFLYVEFEGDFAYIWADIKVKKPHHPRRIGVYKSPQEYGTQIPCTNNTEWYFYDEGRGSTREFNRVRWPNKAPMPLNTEHKETHIWHLIKSLYTKFSRILKHWKDLLY